MSAFETAIPAEEKKSFWSSLHEDIWAVLIGGILIVGVLSFALADPAFKFKIPAYQWSNSTDL